MSRTATNSCLKSSIHLFLLLLWIALDAVAACFSDFNDIYDIERGITDTTAQRTYIICPNKLYEVGYLDFNNNLRPRQDGGPPLPLRPNMKLQCGDDGSRENLCWITDGHLQIDGTAIRGLNDDHLDNVEIVGFVFLGSVQHSTWITKPGSITFKDCEWREHTRSRGPIMLDYHDAYSNNELVVTFEDCLFRDNRYFGLGAQTALVVANSEQNRMIFRRSVFDNNNMMWNNTSPDVSRTHVIESLGPTRIEDSCFINNRVSSAGVVVYGNRLESTLIHTVNTGGTLCQFASVFENLQQYKVLNPKCVDGDESVTTCAHLSGISPPVDDGPVKHFVPFMANALEYDEAFEVGDSQLEGGCNRVAGLQADGPDAQNTDDAVCLQYGGCHISHTRSGEFLVYKFAHDDNYAVDDLVYVDVNVRISSPRVEKQFRLELMYNGQVEYVDTFASPGQGYKEYRTITWENVPLKATESTHSLRFWFVNGNINLCAIGVSYTTEIVPVSPQPTPSPTRMPTNTPTSPDSTPLPTGQPTVSPIASPTVSPTTGGSESTFAVPPITWSALSYYRAFEKTPDTSSGGCNWRNDGVDAQPTTDAICRERDDAVCNIGWWDAEEYLLYRFTIPSNSVGDYDVRVRSASNRAGRHMGMELTKSDGSFVGSFNTYDVPGNGWQNFDDLFWTAVNLSPGDYILKIHSTTGSTNVCSVSILDSESNGGDGGDGESQVVVPGFYSAMYYVEGYSDNTPDNIGNCPYRKNSPVDAKIVNDSICMQAVTEYDKYCHIAFTEPNESLLYNIENKAGKTSLKITFRVASYRSRDVRVELFSADGSRMLANKDVATAGRQDWNIYDTLTVWESVDVGNEDSIIMKVTFLNGQVNLCAFGVE